jgi:hypothetical protein
VTARSATRDQDRVSIREVEAGLRPGRYDAGWGRVLSAAAEADLTQIKE